MKEECSRCRDNDRNWSCRMDYKCKNYSCINFIKPFVEWNYVKPVPYVKPVVEIKLYPIFLIKKRSLQ